MKKRNSKHEKRIKKLIISCGLCAIILGVSTYAWFIGMKTVNISSFDVKVAAIDSLSLSLDGITWSDELTIDETTIKPDTYASNTNTALSTELIPMSSVGKIDKTVSRLVLYEKGSLTATPGGYRIMSSKVKNEGATEADGYIAFDLFVRNLSGKEYYETNNQLNEEAIYLTPESEVKTSANGGVDNTGIENSVRVGFSQIGRVKADTTDTAKIQGISCAGGAGVTTICEERDAQIWEPNDTKHVQNAINWYDTSCKKRTGADLTKSESYSTAADAKCGTVANGTAVPTYAINNVISEKDQVDVYDGAEFNGYTASTTGETAKLFNFPYFTDTNKMVAGVNRPKFITLAPNSITKVRVYIWLEGQDVDNYDFASLGKKISVAFGFTKEQLYGTDVDYDGNPELPEDVKAHPNAPKDEEVQP